MACADLTLPYPVGIHVTLTSTTLQETAGAHRNGTNNDQANLLQQLTTESQNEASQGLDTKSAIEIARIINHEDAKIAAAVKKALPEIAQVIDQVARSLRDGGLIYVMDVIPAEESLRSTRPNAPPLTLLLQDRCNTSWPAVRRRSRLRLR